MTIEQQLEDIQSDIGALRRELREIKIRLGNYEGGFSELVELFKLTMLAIGKLAVAVAGGLASDDPVLTRAHKALTKLGKVMPSISGKEP